jgi:hypothetical protein
VPTIDDALAYLGIDYPDDLIRKNVTRAMATAKETVKEAVGTDLELLLPDDPQAAELVLIFTDDLYSERGVSAKVSGATRRMVADMVLHLQLKMQRLREGGSV